MPKADNAGEQVTDRYLPPQTVPAHTNESELEIDLGDLLYRWVEHIWLILLVTVLGAAISAAYTLFFVTPMYEATSKLYVLNSSDSALNLSDLQIGTYLASDYMEVFKTWEVHEMVITNLGLPYSYSDMQSMLTVTNPNDTRILYITIHSPNAKEAAAIANEYATVALKYIADTMSTEEPNIMSVALEPTNPSSPNKARDILLGLVLGLVASLGWVTLRYISDDKIKSMDEIRRYSNLPVLAVVPTFTTADAKKKQSGKMRKPS